MTVGPWQLLVIAVLLLVVFGAGRLGEIGKGLGQGVRALQKGLAPQSAAASKRRSRRRRPADSDPEPEERAMDSQRLPRRERDPIRADETRQRRHAPARDRNEDERS